MINSNAIILFYFWSRFRFTFYNIRFSSHLYWMKFSLYSLQCVSVSRINERVRFHSCFTFTTTTTTTNVRETWRIRSRQRTVWYCVCVSVVCSGVDIPLRRRSRRTSSRFVRFHDFVFVLRLHRSKQKLKKEEREIIYRQRVSRVSQHRAGQLKKFLANVNAFFASSAVRKRPLQVRSHSVVSSSRNSNLECLSNVFEGDKINLEDWLELKLLWHSCPRIVSISTSKLSSIRTSEVVNPQIIWESFLLPTKICNVPWVLWITHRVSSF